MAGKYPAGSPGVQSFFHKPLAKGEWVGCLTWQDVVLIGEFFATGLIAAKKIISLAGDPVKEPKHYEVSIGASLQAVVQDRVKSEKIRLVSGGIFTGLDADQSQIAIENLGEDIKSTFNGYVGFYDYSVHALAINEERKLLGFAMPGFGKQSASNTFPSSFSPGFTFAPDVKLNGEERACVQCNQCESVCPVDILPDRLFKAVLVDDIDEAEALGISDCVDCQLCTYVCPSKIEIGSIIKTCKAQLVKESAQ